MEKRHHWTIQSSPVKYVNPWIRVVEHQVVRPDGTHGIYGVVDAGDNAGTVVLDEDMNVLLIEEFVFPMNIFTLQIPSGQFRDEHPVDAAKRELFEETGITAANWVSLGDFYFSAGISTQVGHLYLARQLTYGQSQTEATEEVSLRRFPIERVLEMCLTSEIKDSVSVIGILRAVAHLQREGLWTSGPFG